MTPSWFLYPYLNQNSTLKAPYAQLPNGSSWPFGLKASGGTSMVPYGNGSLPATTGGSLPATTNPAGVPAVVRTAGAPATTGGGLPSPFGGGSPLGGSGGTMSQILSALAGGASLPSLIASFYLGNTTTANKGEKDIYDKNGNLTDYGRSISLFKQPSTTGSSPSTAPVVSVPMPQPRPQTMNVPMPPSRPSNMSSGSPLSLSPSSPVSTQSYFGGPGSMSAGAGTMPSGNNYGNTPLLQQIIAKLGNRSVNGVY